MVTLVVGEVLIAKEVTFVFTSVSASVADAGLIVFFLCGMDHQLPSDGQLSNIK